MRIITVSREASPLSINFKNENAFEILSLWSLLQRNCSVKLFFNLTGFAGNNNNNLYYTFSLAKRSPHNGIMREMHSFQWETQNKTVKLEMDNSEKKHYCQWFLYISINHMMAFVCL